MPIRARFAGASRGHSDESGFPAPPEVVAEACAKAAAETGAVVAPANFNSPQQTVIAGAVIAVDRAKELALEAGAKRAVPLPVSAPFHCQLMASAAEKLAGELARLSFATPAVPIVTNVEATPNSDPARIPGLLEQQVTAPVRFTESIQALAGLGVNGVLEIGPGRVLCGLVARIDRGITRHGVSGMDDIEQVVAALGTSKGE